MRFSELLEIVAEEPVFETGLLLVGEVDAWDVRRQLTRWTKDGRLVQLRRGLYALAPPYRQIEPHPFLIANRMVPGSYVSCQSALAHHGWIPEGVPVVTSVAHARPGRWDTPLGGFEFRHIRRDLLWGYDRLEVAPRQRVFVATAEKALLDLIYLEPGADSPLYLAELRLQRLDELDVEVLGRMTERFGKPKLRRAARAVAALARREAEEYVAL